MENEIVSHIVSLMCYGEPAQYFLAIKTEPLLAFRSGIAALVLLFDGEWKNSFMKATSVELCTNNNTCKGSVSAR